MDLFYVVRLFTHFFDLLKLYTSLLCNWNNTAFQYPLGRKESVPMICIAILELSILDRVRLLFDLLSSIERGPF